MTPLAGQEDPDSGTAFGATGDADHNLLRAANTRMRVPPAGWRAHSACASADHDLFVGELDFDQEVRAKAICGECRVRDACLAFSIAHGVQYGIWGGLNSSERERVRQLWSKQRALGVAGRTQQTACL